MSAVHRTRSLKRNTLCAVLGACTLMHVTPVLAQAGGGVGSPAPGAGMAAPVENSGSGAPARAGLQAPMPPEHTQEPAAERSMAFSAGGSQCRDTVPGGPLLAIAYAVVLVVLGAYVALLSRKNTNLSAALLDLEAEINRRSPARKRDGDDVT